MLKTQRAHFVPTSLRKRDKTAVLRLTRRTWRHRERAVTGDCRERKCCYCNIAATSLGTSAAASAARAGLCIGKGRCWAVGAWELGVTEGRHQRERKGGNTSSPKHNTPWLRKACAQLRLEGATAAFLEDPARRSSIVPTEGLVRGFPCGAYPCLAQGQWRNSWPKRKSRGTTSRTWSRVRRDIILPTHSIITVTASA